MSLLVIADPFLLHLKRSGASPCAAGLRNGPLTRKYSLIRAGCNSWRQRSYRDEEVAARSGADCRICNPLQRNWLPLSAGWPLLTE